ncbi:MAG: hypothetical protein U1E65_23295 [Myxococcota bacterium]
MILSALAALLISAAPPAGLEPRLGVVLGDPLQLRLGLELPDVLRIDLGAGWSPGQRRAGLLTIDVLAIWPAMAGVLLDGRVDGRLGLGFRLASAATPEHDVLPGARLPAQLVWVSWSGAYEISFEVAPGVDFGAQHARLSLEGGVGLALRFSGG